MPILLTIPLSYPSNKPGLWRCTLRKGETLPVYSQTGLLVMYKPLAPTHSEVQDIENPALKTRQREIPAEHLSRSLDDDDPVAQVFQKISLAMNAAYCPTHKKPPPLPEAGS